MQVEEGSTTKRRRSPSPSEPKKRMKLEDTKDEDGAELEGTYWQDMWLPEDVLYIIMYRLSRIDLVACRMTCKQWQKVNLEACSRSRQGFFGRTSELDLCKL
jgi:hypothetical protein